MQKNLMIKSRLFLLTLSILNAFFAITILQYSEFSQLLFENIQNLIIQMYFISELNIFYNIGYSFNTFEIVLFQNVSISFLLVFFNLNILKSSQNEPAVNLSIFTSLTLLVFFIFRYSFIIPRINYMALLVIFLILSLTLKLKYNFLLITLLLLLNVFTIKQLYSSLENDIKVYNFISIKEVNNKYLQFNKNFYYEHKQFQDLLLSFNSQVKDEVNIENINSITIYKTSFLSVEVYDNLFKSVFFEYPDSNSNCLFIYHRGHEAKDDFLNLKTQEILNLNVERKCDVLLFDMIGEGINNIDILLPSKDGKLLIKGGSHAELDKFYFEFNNKNSYLTSFLTMYQYKIINEIIDQKNYKNVDLFGFSGGGWTGLFLSILIPDIDKVIIHSGSIPNELDFFYYTNNSEHMEFQDPLFEKYSYFDLYFLISKIEKINPDRALTLIFSDQDPCCFSNPHATTLKIILKNIDSMNIKVEVLEKSVHGFNISEIKQSLSSN